MIKKMMRVLVFLLLLSVFCQVMSVAESVNAGATVAELRRIVIQKYVTKADVLKMVAYLAGKKDISDVNNVIKFLYKKGILKRKFQNNLTSYVTRGYVANLLNRALRLRKGIWESLFGNRYRVAYRKLAKYKIIPPGGYKYYLSGAELLGVIDRANKFQKGEIVW